MMSKELHGFRVCAASACFLLLTNTGMATPVIHSVDGDIQPGGSLIIQGEGFSEKENARPYFLWEADHGPEPRELSRKEGWSRSFSAEESTEIVAPNSSKSYRFDHGASSGAALAGVEFDSDELFVFRRTYEDFHLGEDFAIRTRVNNRDGDISPGQKVTGQSSGATGIIQSISYGSRRDSIFYKQTGGSINEADPVDFEYGEVMTTDTATFQNTEGTSTFPTGTFRTFNFKTFRMWHTDQHHNIYVGAGQTQRFNIVPERTDGAFNNGSMEDPLMQRPKEWKSEEVRYRAGSIGERDGIMDFMMDNSRHYDYNFVMRNDSRPDRYNIVYQSQVSNGAQPDSWIYFDHLYIDDSWHHVAACDAASWSECRDKALQAPLEWQDNQITVEFNPRHLSTNDDFYLYVVDGEGNANEEGFRVCMKCPESPELRVE